MQDSIINHNLDTSREYYPNVISTRSFDDRLDTLSHVREAGLKVCSSGIVGLGEETKDRIGLLFELATLPIHPESVPINMLVPMQGTPLAEVEKLDVTEWIRTIAVARIIMPKSYIRLSAGRESLSDADQALAFMAGAIHCFRAKSYSPHQIQHKARINNSFKNWVYMQKKPNRNLLS